MLFISHKISVIHITNLYFFLRISPNTVTSFIGVSHVRKHHPERILESAVKGMLPKNKLGRKMMTHLRIYSGPTHPHFAQNPKEIDL